MAEGGAKFMAAEGVDRVEWENFEELRNKCWEALRCTCDLVSRLRGRLGILTEGKQGRSLFKNARNREALRVRDRNAGRNILWERLLKFWNCRMRTWYGFSKLKMPLPSRWWSLELIMKNMLVDRKERHWFDSEWEKAWKKFMLGSQMVHTAESLERLMTWTHFSECSRETLLSPFLMMRSQSTEILSSVAWGHIYFCDTARKECAFWILCQHL